MKIKQGFILREVASSFVVVAVGEAVKSFNGIINLNDTGAFLWRQLEKNVTKNDLVSALTSEYDVDDATALHDVEAFVAKLSEAGLLE